MEPSWLMITDPFLIQMSSNIPKKLEKFNNFVSNSFKVKDDVVCTCYFPNQCDQNDDLTIILLLLDQEAPMGICSKEQSRKMNNT